ncbi:uncharacterized protein [Dendropsophus ebraccatus]|uniref:uncharacterized protein isoform X2 n=1 Tax=Dendropsophus ebraccatus TaxID=150705 RepID=UPI003831851A
MEIAFMDHVRHSLMIDRNKDVIIDKLLNLTLEIICLLTGEDYVVMRKSGDPRTAEKRGCRVSDMCGEAQGVVTAASPPPPAVTEENHGWRIPEAAETLHRDPKKLPIKSEDAQVSAWEQKDNMAVSGPESGCPDARRSTGSPSRKCRTPLCAQDYGPQERQAEPPEDGVCRQQCKEEEDAAIPDDIGSGADDCTDPPEQCRTLIRSEEFSEEDNEMMAQEYQASVGDDIFQPLCKEEVGSDYTNSDPVVSSLDAMMLRQCSQVQDPFPDHSDPVAFQKSLCTSNLFSCSVCGVRFSSETTFAAHQRFHSEEKSYDCTFCGKSFNQRSRLLSHKRKHTGEKPFSCPVCGRCFAERSALVTHQRIHSGEKPFNCTECSRSFVQRSSLVKHQRIHTGERPFVCSQCGRCFSQSSNLVRHQRILHQFL